MSNTCTDFLMQLTDVFCIEAVQADCKFAWLLRLLGPPDVDGGHGNRTAGGLKGAGSSPGRVCWVDINRGFSVVMLGWLEKVKIL